MVTRRSFLAAAAAGAVGLTGCSDVRSARLATGASPIPPTTPTPTAPSRVPPDWPTLRIRLAGALSLPEDPGYPVSARAYNPLFDRRRPAAVAHCLRTEDVQACVELAGRAEIPVAARSGGHSYAGYSNPDQALVVDLRPLSRVTVEPDGTALVGAGARLAEVHTALAAAGRCLPAGTGPTVGIAGLTLGGGVGPLSRRYGLTCDRLRSASVVTADGRLRTVSATEEPDLFWALRGGGGGNLGVVTSFTFATDPAPELTVFTLTFRGDAAAVLGGWQDWVRTAPDELSTRCVLDAGHPPTVRITGCVVGDEPACRRQLDRLRPAPSTRAVRTMRYLDAMRHVAGCDRLGPEQCRPETEGGRLGRAAFVASSRVLTRPVDPAGVVALLDGLVGVTLLLDSLGGAVARTAPADTAFPHRTALATAQIRAGTADGVALATRQVADVRDGLGQLAGQHGYVNYIDPTMPNWANAYYGANLPRLRQVAARYDPAGVFAFAQGITAPAR